MPGEKKIIKFGGMLVAMSIAYWALIAHLAVNDFKCTDYDDMVDRCASIDALRLFFVFGSIAPYLLLLLLAFVVRHFTRKAP